MKLLAKIAFLLFFISIIYTCKKEEPLVNIVNKAPEISEIQVTPSLISTNSLVTLTAIATDPEGGKIEYTWNCSTGSFKSTIGQSVNWTAPAEVGKNTVTLTVNDGKLLATKSATIDVIAAVTTISSTVNGFVYYSGTKIPVSGVTVSINNKSFTTSITGSFSITEIPSGNAELIATKPDYDPFKKSIILNSGANQINIEITSGIFTHTINGTVRTSIGTEIPGVSVSLLNGDNSNTNIHDQTDANGDYQLPAIPQGQMKIAFSKAGFDNSQNEIFVSNSNRVFDVVLKAKLITSIDPVVGTNTLGNNQIKWSSNYGPELLGFNIYRSKNPSGNYIKINTSIITLYSDPPFNGFIFYNDPVNNIFTTSYYKISVVNMDSNEGPMSNYVLVTPIFSVPFVSITSVTSLGFSTATIGGIVTNDGGDAVTDRGFFWGTTSNPENTGSKLQIGTGTGSYSTGLNNLAYSTKYYVRAYATNNIGTTYSSNEESFETLSYGSTEDIDGNVYKTIAIGTQTWMAENLKTTKYNDNSDIPLVEDFEAWSLINWYSWTTPAYCWYDNEEANYKATYGALYNWHTVNTGKLCPMGWHVPTDAEWTVLTDYLGGEAVAGGKLKETGLAHWLDPNTSAINETGFSALPGGSRLLGGSFHGIGEYGSWWSSTAYSANPWSWCLLLKYNSGLGDKTFTNQPEGYSVRCLRDF